MTVLVTGGAGYIGANMSLALLQTGETPVAVDNLLTGAAWLVPDAVELTRLEVGNIDAVRQLIESNSIDEVIHFAGSTLVPESIERPLDYYLNNTAQTIALLKACALAGVKRFIFSSTAAVYGTPDTIPVNEKAAVHSISPYGASMAMSERIVQDAAVRNDMSFAILRYFNVAGADPKSLAGQIGKPTHLIRVASQIAAGVRDEALKVFGTDYATPDGTAVRDYVHVTDLADAHLQALQYLRAGGQSKILNCGYGRGYSVREVINSIERVSDTKLELELCGRRSGDPAQLIADSATIRSTLDWRPRFDDIDLIARTAIDWELKLAEREEKADE